MKKVLKVLGIILVIILAIVVIALIALNKEKDSITAATFQTTMEEQGYTLFETTEQFAQYEDYMAKSYAAQKSDYQIEFYELTSEENAIGMFNTNKELFKNESANVSASSSVSAKNYATFSLTTNGSFKYLSRIDNTLVYVDVDEQYKGDVKDAMKEIGY